MSCSFLISINQINVKLSNNTQKADWLFDLGVLAETSGKMG